MSRDFQLVLKRGFDFVAALIGLIALLPLFALIAVCVWLDSPGPVFFRLRMAGRDGKAFDQWKFRTMVKDAREKAHPFETSATDPRITRVGRFLRRWSLDELPQLWNVLRGEMSLVGPRPAFIEIASRYSALEMGRLRMRPGLTGLAQIHGRNLLPWPERVAFDLEYIEHFSLWLDLKILLRTIPVVLRSEGVYGEDGKVRMHDLA
ncbi:MAG: sugar transferase [Candidatus Acidiferrales bacterium]